MVDYQYTYILGNLILLALWITLFLWRKDTRKEMLIISIIFGVIAILSYPLYALDWWKPLTITNTGIGIEDFLFGFGIGGVSSVIYSFISNKKVKLKETKRNFNIFYILLILAIVFGGGMLFLKMNSFVATTLAFIISTSIIYFKRKDLIKDSLLSGIFTLIIAILIYQILNFMTPGFFNEFWLFQNIGKITFLKIPLEELIWFFLAGSFIGPLYEYWKEGKLINIRNIKK